MTATVKAHAKDRPPSAAKRWLSCPFTAQLVQMYPNEPTEASLKGDFWHELMEDTITFGFVPPHAPPDEQEAMEDLLSYVLRRKQEMGGKSAQIYIEQRLDIPETGDFGTADVILVSNSEIEIIDLKSGYVPVDVFMNAQMLTYLLGVIALYGHKRKYVLSIHQPNYDHIEGQIRSFTCTDEEVEWFRNEVRYSMEHPDEIKAGKHCKDTYCPHRGACAPFKAYVHSDLELGWHTSEIHAMDDDTLAKALDAADELAGYRNAIRGEAMKRIMNLDRTIHGYKVVKGRKSRTVLDPLKLVAAFQLQLGIEWARKLFPTLAWAGEALPIGDPDVLKELGTPKHIEDVCKLYAQENKLPRGGWKGIYDNVAGPYIRETHSGLTLEKAIDGRPAHKRGSEFGVLAAPGTVSII